MKRSYRILAQVLLTVWLMSLSAAADILVVVIEESALSFQDRPSSFSNSPTNFRNSRTNFVNSANNFHNSSNGYKNSRSNFANGKFGKQRLLNERGEWLGYYTTSDSGVLNFYSTSGKRVFYHPANPETRGAFYSEESGWAGLLAEVRGRLCLCLTQQAYGTLLSHQR